MLNACFRSISLIMLAKIQIISYNASIFLKKAKKIFQFVIFYSPFFTIIGTVFACFRQNGTTFATLTQQRYELYLSQMR